MKTLVIGMDGVDNETFQRGWTPFIESLVKKGQHLGLKEDLITRGWSEIILGADAQETGAFYDRPVGGQTYAWTDKFRISDVPGLGDSVKPIWQVLNEYGYKVGIMNVPTTFPAPKVDGFFVSGGGGGGPVAQDVSLEQCFPEAIKSELDTLNYILDERIGSLLFEKNLKTPEQFFSRLGEMASRRTDAFILLSEKYDIDFGLLVYRATMVAETIAKPVLREPEDGAAVRWRAIRMAIKSFYQQFDRDLQRLVECFPGAEIIFVSDHGTTLRRYSVNLNRFLQQRGYQKGSQKKGLFYQLATNLRHWVPQGVRQRLKAKGRISNVYAGMAPFDIRNAIAFNNTRRNEIHGIFINDENRFGGTVKSDDIRNLAYQIAEDLNSDPCAREHGISARVNESRGAPFSDQYPDIMIDLPDGYLPSNQGRDFVEPYKISGDCGNLEAMRGDEKHCIKSHRPLAVNVNHDWKARNRDKVNDLRLIYDHISAIFLNRSDSSKKI